MRPSRDADENDRFQEQLTIARGVCSVFLLKLLDTNLPKVLDTFFCAIGRDTTITIASAQRPLEATTFPINKFLVTSNLRSFICAQDADLEVSTLSQRYGHINGLIRISSRIVVGSNTLKSIGRQFEISLLLRFDAVFPTVDRCAIVYDEDTGTTSELSGTQLAELSNAILRRHWSKLPATLSGPLRPER